MGCKYVILFDPVIKDCKLYEGEKEIEKAVAILLPSKIKTDEQAVRKFRRMKVKNKLEQRAKEIRLCKILR